MSAYIEGQQRLTLDEDLSVGSPDLLLRSILFDLLGILVLCLHEIISIIQYTSEEEMRTMSDGRRMDLQALPLSMSPATPRWDTRSDDEAYIVPGLSRRKYFRP
jgi:hypothetical protein